MNKRWMVAVGGISLAVALSASWAGQSQPASPSESAAEEVARQKELLLKTSGILPGELYVAQGEELFFQVRGPKGKSLADCDWGGEGESGLEGAYARMPRFFEDTGKVEDLDSRIRSCMTRVQGLRPEDVKRSEVAAIAAFVASRSNGYPVRVALDHPQMRAMYQAGEALWYRRAGQMDFSCAVCHDHNPRRRIRLQTLAAVKEDAVASHWPAYRFSNDQLWTMEDRIRGCYSQVRVDPPDFYSDTIIALEVYLSYQANGSLVDSPGFVR